MNRTVLHFICSAEEVAVVQHLVWVDSLSFTPWLQAFFVAVALTRDVFRYQRDQVSGLEGCSVCLYLVQNTGEETSWPKARPLSVLFRLRGSSLKIINDIDECPECG